MQTTKSILLFGDLVPLSKDFVNTTKLNIITGDVGEILLELLKSVYAVPVNKSLIEFKKKMICNVILLINNIFGDDNKETHLLEDMVLTKCESYRTLLIILFRFCYIVMPIIDYLEVDDRLLISSGGWVSFLSLMYEELRSKEKYSVLFNTYDWRIVEKKKSKRYVSLLERYVLPNNHKVVESGTTFNIK